MRSSLSPPSLPPRLGTLSSRHLSNQPRNLQQQPATWTLVASGVAFLGFLMLAGLRWWPDRVMAADLLRALVVRTLVFGTAGTLVCAAILALLNWRRKTADHAVMTITLAFLLCGTLQIALTLWLAHRYDGRLEAAADRVTRGAGLVTLHYPDGERTILPMKRLWTLHAREGNLVFGGRKPRHSFFALLRHHRRRLRQPASIATGAPLEAVTRNRNQMIRSSPFLGTSGGSFT